MSVAYPRATRRGAAVDWVKFDSELARDGSVDPVDKALYAAIASFVDSATRESPEAASYDPNNLPEWVPTRKRLGECIGRSVDVVDRSIKRLEAAGLLKVHRQPDPNNPRRKLPSEYELLDHHRWDERAAERAARRVAAGHGGRADAATPDREDAGTPSRADAATPSRADAATPSRADAAVIDREVVREGDQEGLWGAEAGTQAEGAPGRASQPPNLPMQWQGPESFEPAPIDRDGFTLTDAMRRWAAKTVPGINPDLETAKFVAHFRAENTHRPNWSEQWRKWMVRAAEYAAQDQMRAATRPPTARDARQAAVQQSRALLDQMAEQFKNGENPWT